MHTPWREFGVNKRLASIVERCLAPDPNARYESADALVADLQRELSLFSRTRRWLRAHRLPVLSGAAFLLVLCLCLTAYLLTRPSYAERERQKGMADLLAYKYPPAVDHFTRSLDADPSQPEALFARARAYAAIGRYSNALEDMKLSVGISDDPKKLAFLGYCCSCTKAHGDATRLYERAIEKGYRSALLYNNLGVSYYRQGLMGPALNALDGAIATDGDCQLARVNRAIVRCAVSVGEMTPPTAAIRDMEIALSLGECSGDVYFAAAKIFAHAASANDAWKSRTLDCLQRALEHGVSVTEIESDDALSAVFHDFHLSKSFSGNFKERRISS